MKEKILEIKQRAEKQMSEWNFPNEHYIEAQGALMVCEELLADEPDGEVGDEEPRESKRPEPIKFTYTKQEIENQLIDFGNWYLRLIKVTTDKNERFNIENRDIIWSFLRGDNYKLWWEKLGFYNDKEHSEKTYKHNIGSTTNFTTESEQQPNKTFNAKIGHILDVNLQLDMPRPIKAKMKVVREVVELFEQYHKSQVRDEIKIIRNHIATEYEWFVEHSPDYGVIPKILKYLDEYLNQKP